MNKSCDLFEVFEGLCSRCWDSAECNELAVAHLSSKLIVVQTCRIGCRAALAVNCRRESRAQLWFYEGTDNYQGPWFSCAIFGSCRRYRWSEAVLAVVRGYGNDLGNLVNYLWTATITMTSPPTIPATRLATQSTNMQLLTYRISPLYQTFSHRSSGNNTGHQLFCTPLRHNSLPHYIGAIIFTTKQNLHHLRMPSPSTRASMRHLMLSWWTCTYSVRN